MHTRIPFGISSLAAFFVILILATASGLQAAEPEPVLFFDARADQTGSTNGGTAIWSLRTNTWRWWFQNVTQAKVSPNGKQVVYIYQNNLFITDVKGQTAQLLSTNAAYPAWSPQGDRIAFFHQSSLRIITPAGVVLQTPVTNVFNYHPPSWSPDGRKIAFSGGITVQEVGCEFFEQACPAYRGLGTIYSVELATGVQTPLFTPTYISTEGAKYVANGTTYTPITSEQVRLDHPVWSPDGQRIAARKLVWRWHSRSATVGTGWKAVEANLVTIPAAGGGEPTAITSDTNPSPYGDGTLRDSFPVAWAEDGLYYFRQRGGSLPAEEQGTYVTSGSGPGVKVNGFVSTGSQGTGGTHTGSLQRTSLNQNGIKIQIAVPGTNYLPGQSFEATVTLISSEDGPQIVGFSNAVLRTDDTKVLQVTPPALPAPFTLTPQIPQKSFVVPVTARQDGTAQLLCTISVTDSNNVVTLQSSSSVIRVWPPGDLLIKRDVESSRHFGLDNVYQTTASGEQRRTNTVTRNELSQFQVQIQNDGAHTANYCLTAFEGTNEGWKVQYLWNGQDISAQVHTTKGATFPPLATNDTYLVILKVTSTNAPLGANRFVTLSLRDTNQLAMTLDAVQAVTETALEIIVNSTGDLADKDPNDCCPDTGGKIKDGSPEVTLRAAMEFANKHPGKDIIKFQIPADDPDYNSGRPRILPATALPNITESVRIDGRTQNPSDLVPHIEVSGQLLQIPRPAVFSKHYPADLLVQRQTAESGIVLVATNCEIRGLAITRFPVCGIFIYEFSYYNIIQGNHIGVAEGGTLPAANGSYGYNTNGHTPTGAGIAVMGPYNLIGGDSPDKANVISGAGGMIYQRYSMYGPFKNAASPPGILIYGGWAYDNWVEGNIIGLDPSGRRPPNLPAENDGDTNPYQQSGVVIGGGAHHNLIGGWTAGAANTIALNWEQVGIHDLQTYYNTVAGNRIGFDLDRAGVLANYRQDGIVVHNGYGNLIGGAYALSPNFVAGQRRGIVVQGSTTNTYNEVIGNSVGVNPLQSLLSNDNGIQVSGEGGTIYDNTVLYSRHNGVVLSNATRITVESNDIHHNRELGILVTSSGANQITGNAIHGNGSGSEFDAPIGAKLPSLGGIYLKNSTDILISANQIYGDTGLGISLKSGNKPTPNDPGDADSGANSLLNYPVINGTNLPPVGGTTGLVARAALNTISNVAGYKIQFFASARANLSGYGEGERYLGSVSVQTDNQGFASILLQTNRSVQPGEFLTATTITTDGNTSEFSKAVLIQGPTKTPSGISKEVQDQAPPPLKPPGARPQIHVQSDPPPGDGNGDGILDSTQLNVCSFPGIAGRWLTLAAPNSATLVNVQPEALPEFADLPDGYTFPVGFMSFSVTGLVAGATVNITNIFHDAFPCTTVLAFGPTPDNAQPHWYEFLSDGTTGAALGTNQIVFTFRDGRRGDHDRQTNGVITTILAPANFVPAGPALRVLSNAVSIVEVLSFTPDSTPSPVPITNRVPAMTTVLAWPASATNWALEFSDDLSTTNLWQPVAETPALIGNQRVVTNTSIDIIRYYRLFRND